MAHLDAIDRNVTAAQERLTELKAQAAAAAASLWAFLGALVGALVAVGAGIIGARSPITARRG